MKWTRKEKTDIYLKTYRKITRTGLSNRNRLSVHTFVKWAVTPRCVHIYKYLINSNTIMVRLHAQSLLVLRTRRASGN